MRLLADANIEPPLVRWLRAEGHDVLWAGDLPPACPDSALVNAAKSDGRIILTYDRDFGELAFLDHLVAEGIILLRFDAGPVQERLSLLQCHWSEIMERVSGHFVVVTDVKVRARLLP